MKQMYPGIPFSPYTSLTQPIGPGDTVIYVEDSGVFPEGPNLATIGNDENAETIQYAQKAAGLLSGCVRGVEGPARAWQVDEVIARNFTALDQTLIMDNIVSLSETKSEKPTAYEAGDLAEIGENGNIRSSGKKAESFIPKIAAPVAGNFVVQTSSGAIASSGKSPEDYALTAEGVKRYYHAKNGTVHALVGPEGAATIYFEAVADYEHGDTWTLNGTGITATYRGGEPLLPTAVLTMDIVNAHLESGKLVLDISKPAPQENILINGDDVIAQRGEGAARTDGNQYMTDHWSCFYQGVKWDRILNDGPAPCKYALKITATTLNSYNNLAQPIEDYTPLVGKQVTLSYWVKRHGEGPVSLNGTELSDTWQLFTQTYTFSNTGHSTGYPSVLIGTAINSVPAGSGYIIADRKLEIGRRFTGHFQENVGTTLRKCQRYYEVIDNTGSGYYPKTIYAVNESSGIVLQSYKVTKRVVPTVIVNGALEGETVSFRDAFTNAFATGTLSFWNEMNAGGLMLVQLEGSGAPFIKGDIYEAKIIADAEIR